MDERTLSRLGRITLSLAPRASDASVSASLLSAREMLRLKRMSGMKIPRGGRREVDVLAFPEPAGFPESDAHRKFLGDVYLNRGIALHPEDGTVVRLLVHGVLHLLGYRHAGKRDTIAMEMIEKKLWRQLFLLA